MILQEAQNILSAALAPFHYHDFFEQIVGKKPLALIGRDNSDLPKLLGDNPEQSILNAYDRYSDKLTCHIATPTTAPPKAHKTADPEAFLQLIKAYHASGYTVRIPDVEKMAPPLSQFTRALEQIFNTKVGVVIFWSDNDSSAPVHYDELDVIAIQLKGQKRWLISDEPSHQPNAWKGWGEAPPNLGRHQVYDVGPGDLLYLPRGTAHTAQSLSESIHLSIGFVPVTVRETLIALIDNLADINQPLRSNAGLRADNITSQDSLSCIVEQLQSSVQNLASQSQSAAFVQQSLNKRKARLVFDLAKLQHSQTNNKVLITSTIKHHPLAISELVATPEILDLRIPGEQILIHPGAQEALQYILNTPSFVVSNIPGGLGDEVKIALVNRLIMSGFLTCYA
ncbi:JmjC domain-containing protein [Paraglaciecola aestuariivivens]